jgi:hypothetical protein
MASKQFKSREEQRAAIAKEIAELNGEIERLKYSLEHTENKETPIGDPANAALRMAIAPSRASSV